MRRLWLEAQPGFITAVNAGNRSMSEGQAHGKGFAIAGFRAEFDIVAEERDIVDRHGKAIVDLGAR